MIKVGANYGIQSKCPICLKEDDNQEHLFLCEQFNKEQIINPNDFFTDQQNTLKIATDKLDQILRKREKILSKT